MKSTEHLIEQQRKHRRRRREAIELSALVFIAFIVGWSILLYYVTPRNIIESIGVHNSYLVVVLGGFFGGVSLFFPFPNYILVFTLGSAGLNPYALGILAGLGTLLGECTSYIVGHVSRPLLSERVHYKLDRFNLWSKRHPFVLSLGLFLYGCVPLPNDFILVPLGLARHSFWRVMLPLGLGNIVFNIGAALAGQYGFMSLIGLA